ncbi:MAG: Peptidase [Candidatus Saccharibacteria bacterium]|nr:Peptidase [Candidatus Saccharibacteria bacterium]
MTHFKQKKKQIGVHILAILFVFVGSFFVNNLQVNAFGEYEDYYSRNNILLYDKAAPDCSAGSTKAVSSVAGTTTETTIKTEKTANTDIIWNFLTKTAFSTNGSKPMSDAQAAGVMGNMYAESSMRPDAVEATTRIDKGHGLVQWTFGRWDGSNGLLTFATSKGANWADVTIQMQFLQKELESSEKSIFSDTEFNGAPDPGTAASRWRVVFERANVQLAHDDKRIGAATSFFNLYGGKSSGGSDCTSASGVVAGSLVKTALYFALDAPIDDGHPNKEAAKATYQNEKLTYNPSGDWSDCGGFIATVVIASGVDKNYPKLGVGNQINYVRSHPELYSVNENPTAASLKPGDILYIPSHTTMYTGEEKYPSADASWHDRVPSVRTSGSAQWMIANGAISATYIGKTAGGGGGGGGF